LTLLCDSGLRRPFGARAGAESETGDPSCSIRSRTRTRVGSESMSIRYDTIQFSFVLLASSAVCLSLRKTYASRLVGSRVVAAWAVDGWFWRTSAVRVCCTNECTRRARGEQSRGSRAGGGQGREQPAAASSKASTPSTLAGPAGRTHGWVRCTLLVAGRAAERARAPAAAASGRPNLLGARGAVVQHRHGGPAREEAPQEDCRGRQAIRVRL
jgi:hypothetical protein